MRSLGSLSQEQIVFGLAVTLCVVFALTLPGFLTTNNILNLLHHSSLIQSSNEFVLLCGHISELF